MILFCVFILFSIIVQNPIRWDLVNSTNFGEEDTQNTSYIVLHPIFNNAFQEQRTNHPVAGLQCVEIVKRLN